jgi:3-oxoacyl-[acyl-carrier-protein] synthase III
MGSAITAMHYCIPRRRLGNEELASRFGEKQLQSIVKMAGIRERRIVAPGETAADLAYWAASRLLDDRQISASEIDLLVFASQTGDYQLPATACVLHGRLGMTDQCAALDINLGCSSFPYGLSVVHGMITAGLARKALLLNAEAITTLIHPQDRGLIPLHGDGAAATLVEPCSERGIRGFLLGTLGEGYEHLIIPASGARCPRSAETKQEIADESGIVRTAENLHMNGPAIFHFSVYKVPEVVRRALDQMHLTIDDVDLVLLHQANKTMVDLIYKALKVPEEKRFYFLEEVGNMSGASSPVLLAEAWRQERVKPGTRTLVASFGVGLSWGVVVIDWPENLQRAVQGSVEPGESENDRPAFATPSEAPPSKL